MERIERETASLCHATSPKDPSVGAGSGPSDTEKAHLSRMPTDPVDIRKPSWPAPEQWSYPTGNSSGSGSFGGNLDAFQGDSQGQPQHNSYPDSTFNMNPSSAGSPSNQPYQWYFDSDAAFHEFQQTHAQQDVRDAMEIPYAQGFAWPQQDMPNAYYGMSQDCEGQGQGSASGASGHEPVTSNDIAAFMRINPAEHPFR